MKRIAYHVLRITYGGLGVARRVVCKKEVEAEEEENEEKGGGGEVGVEGEGGEENAECRMLNDEFSIAGWRARIVGKSEEVRERKKHEGQFSDMANLGAAVHERPEGNGEEEGDEQSRASSEKLAGEAIGGGDGERAEECRDEPHAEQTAASECDPSGGNVMIDRLVPFGLNEVERELAVEHHLSVPGRFNGLIVAPARGNDGEAEDAEGEGEEENK